MLVRLGYACISETVNLSTSSPYTYTEYLKGNDLGKLDRVIRSNLSNLEEIIKYNIKNSVHFYRMSSKIIPLATKKDVEFDYIDKYKKYYAKIGGKILRSKMRVDFHPDEYVVLNSTKRQVVEDSIRSLEYLYRILDVMKIKNKVLVLHVGSSTFGKDNSIKRFANNFNKLPIEVQKCIAIENDDKVFNVEDVIKLAELIKVPVILDYHHYLCNKSKIDYRKIFASWDNKKPKLHYSSPKNKREFRSHSDYIDSDDFIRFLEIIKRYNVDVDIMIEAKKKDEAMFRLLREIRYKTNYVFIDSTSFIVN